MKITRKDFFKKTIKSAVLITIPSYLTPLLESCNNGMEADNSTPLPSIQGNLSNGKVTITIGSSSPLAKTGTAALVNFSSGFVLVDHPSENVYNGLTSVCTHQSCTVSNIDAGSSQFVCPCHGSRFDFNGKVTKGPASSPLTILHTEKTGDQLIITMN